MQGLVVPGIVVALIAYIAEEFGQSGGVARMTATYVGGTIMGGFSGRFIRRHLKVLTQGMAINRVPQDFAMRWTTCCSWRRYGCTGIRHQCH